MIDSLSRNEHLVFIRLQIVEFDSLRLLTFHNSRDFFYNFNAKIASCKCQEDMIVRLFFKLFIRLYPNLNVTMLSCLA